MGLWLALRLSLGLCLSLRLALSEAGSLGEACADLLKLAGTGRLVLRDHVARDSADSLQAAVGLVGDLGLPLCHDLRLCLQQSAHSALLLADERH